jgi:mono/diheme cytochrome c family protein
VLLALSTAHKVGLFTVAAIFIVFAVLCSFVFPRMNANFPGRRMGLFLAAVAILTIAELGAVERFAVESESEAAEPAETTTTESTTTAPPPTGDVTAGEKVFAASGCAACHTLTEANASGTVGPNLDEALKGKDAGFIRESIVNPDAEIAPGYSKGVMPGNFGTSLTETQINDLVALLSQNT